MSNSKELKDKFWVALAKSPFVFLTRDSDPHGAVPMTAQLDKNADSVIWFFTGRDRPLASGGAATATFAANDHQLFARFSGVLTEETSPERLDQFWSPIIDAWFPKGKDDPNLLLLRMDLGQAEIWNSDLGLIDNLKMLLGFDSRVESQNEHVKTYI